MISEAWRSPPPGYEEEEEGTGDLRTVSLRGETKRSRKGVLGHTIPFSLGARRAGEGGWRDQDFLSTYPLAG